jgi:four helix bundle protein
MHKYEELRVYQRALDLVALVYRLTASWPADERFGLTSQVRRAATSIVLNIAEGAGAGSDVEFAKFLRYSLRSKYEVMAGIDIAVRIGLIAERDAPAIRQEAEDVASMLVGLIRSLGPASGDRRAAT